MTQITLIDTPVISVPENKIRDYIDGKLRNDTPEEYVRQNIERRLVNELGYPKGCVKVEFGIKMGSGKPRIDIAIFPKDTLDFAQENIYLIIECKKENLKPTDKKDGVGQLKSYMSGCANAIWGMWTNGKDKEVWRKVINQKGEIEFHEYIDIPAFGKDSNEDDRPKRNEQRKAVADNLLLAFKKCHNHIYAMEGMQKQPAFFELLKIIFCKIEDEKNVFSDIEFYVTPRERNNPDGQLTVRKRIDKIFEKVKNKYKVIFADNDKLQLQPRTLAYLVGEIQDYDLLKTNIDVKGKAYEEIVGANLRGDRGEFFTPRNVMKMAVEMIAPKIGEKILDSSCGTGGFLVQSMNYVMQQIENQVTNQFGKERGKWDNYQEGAFIEKVKEVASACFFGFDINPDLVKATKMNMVMNNDGSGNILRCNSLLPPHEWDLEFKKDLAKALNIDSLEITNHKKIDFFDVIVTNPPFGSKIPIIDRSILSQFDIAGNSNSVPPEQLFVERCVQFLKPGGRLAIVLPDSILGAPGLVHIRKWLIENCWIVASLDLHADTFQPRNGTQTSILIVQKKTEEERLRKDKQPFQIFMALVNKVGHDKRGNSIYKRDKNGELLYFKEKRINENGEVEEYEERKLDDQTVIIPEVFKEWKKQQGVLW